jgi:hypothetical protein
MRNADELVELADDLGVPATALVVSLSLSRHLRPASVTAATDVPPFSSDAA